MIRRPISAMILALLTVALSSGPASALETLEDARCVCVDGVLGTGDYVSCLAKMTRRLVAADNLTMAERSDAVSGASSEDLEALADVCADRGGDLGLEGWGVSVHVGTPFYPAASPSGPTSAAITTVRLWNLSPRDLWMFSNVSGGPEGCLFRMTVRDEDDLVVRQENAICLQAFRNVEMTSGEILEFETLVPLVALASDPAAGVIDGEKLPSGRYKIVLSWNLTGPETISGSLDFRGPMAEAVIPIRVGSTPPN